MLWPPPDGYGFASSSYQSRSRGYAASARVATGSRGPAQNWDQDRARPRIESTAALAPEDIWMIVERSGMRCEIRARRVQNLSGFRAACGIRGELALPRQAIVRQAMRQFRLPTLLLRYEQDSQAPLGRYADLRQPAEGACVTPPPAGITRIERVCPDFGKTLSYSSARMTQSFSKTLAVRLGVSPPARIMSATDPPAGN